MRGEHHGVGGLLGADQDGEEPAVKHGERQVGGVDIDRCQEDLFIVTNVLGDGQG